MIIHLNGKIYDTVECALVWKGQQKYKEPNPIRNGSYNFPIYMTWIYKAADGEYFFIYKREDGYRIRSTTHIAVDKFLKMMLYSRSIEHITKTI